MLLLHGLAGTALEWERTASWLRQTHHVLAPDQRGHGRSERHPATVSAADLVEDVLAVLDQLEIRRVRLVGQSFGGQTAFLTAARRPDAVSALVVAEASPAAGDAKEVAGLRAWLGTWPVPFSSLDEALRFFGGDTPAAWAWAAGLEQRGGRWWPSFDVDVVVRTLAASSGNDHWPEWESIAAPTLIVRGERGWLSAAHAEEMSKRLPRAKVAEVPGAGHDVHLEAPEEWRRIVEEFLRSLLAE